MRRKQLIASILLYNFIGLTVALGGWLWEVILFLVKDQQFVNRGFLYGPYLPVYGTGAVLLSILFYHKDIAAIIIYGRLGASKFPKDFYHGRLYSRLRTLLHQVNKKKRTALRNSGSGRVLSHVSEKPACRKNAQKQIAEDIRVFLICMFGGSLIEFMIGWFLWHVFHRKYWDYSGYVFNVSGYICLFSALGFGIFGLLWIKGIAPYLIRAWEQIRFSIQILIVGLSDMLLLADAVFSLMQPNSGKNITFSFGQLLRII